MFTRAPRWRPMAAAACCLAVVSIWGSYQETTSSDVPAFWYPKSPLWNGDIFLYPDDPASRFHVGWTSSLVPEGFLVKRPSAARMAAYPTLVYGTPCHDLQVALDEIGLDGLVERTSAMNFHLIGQIVGARGSDGGDDQLKAVAETLQAFAKVLWSVVTYTGGSNGIVHGKTWYILGSGKGEMSWEYIFATLCPNVEHSSDFNSLDACVHGAGHGAFIYYTQQSYSTCSGVLAFNIEDSQPAYEFCMAAPGIWMAEQCLSGYYHPMSTKTASPWPVTWRDPCVSRARPRAGSCFIALFIEGVVIYGDYTQAPQRRRQLRAAGPWTTWCFAEPRMEDWHADDCIHGLSATLYPLFYYVTAMRPGDSPGDPALTLEDCLEIPWFFIVTSDAPYWCTVLFEQYTPGSLLEKSRTPLVAYCELFAGPQLQGSNRRLQIFWRCMRGVTTYFYNILSTRPDYVDHSEREFTAVCAELLEVTWLNSSDKTMLFADCNVFIRGYTNFSQSAHDHILEHHWPAYAW